MKLEVGEIVVFKGNPDDYQTFIKEGFRYRIKDYVEYDMSTAYYTLDKTGLPHYGGKQPERTIVLRLEDVYKDFTNEKLYREDQLKKLLD